MANHDSPVDVTLILQDASEALKLGQKVPRDRVHFDRAILLYETACNLVTEPTPLRATSLRSLAVAHEQRYRYFNVQGDLSSAINLSKEALQLLPEGHADYVAGLCCISQCIRARFLYFGKGKDLQHAVSLAEKCLSLCPSGHPERDVALENFIATLYAKHQRLKEPDDLDLILNLQETVLDLRPSGHPLRSQSLLDLSDTLLARFELRDERADIDAAVTHLEERLSDPSTGDRASVATLQDYSSGVWKRYLRFRDISDLDLYISAREQIVDHFPSGDPGRSVNLRSLCRAVHIRADDSKDLSTFQRAITLFEELLQILPSDDKSRARVVSDLADALESLAQFGPNTVLDEDRVLALREEAVSVSSQEEQEYTSALCVLGSALDRRYDLTSDPAYRDRAITSYKTALVHFQDDDPDRVQCLVSLASDIRWRYVSDRRRDDLLEALALFEEAELRKQAMDDSTRILFFAGYTSVMLYRFRDLHFPTAVEIDRLIALGEETMEICPEDHEYRAGVCGMFAQILQNRFTLSWEPAYLHRAIPFYREALDKFPSGDAALVPCTIKLADALKVLHLLFYKSGDLDESIRIYERAMQDVPDDHANRVDVLCGLSDALRLRYKHQGREEDAESSLSLAQQAIRFAPDDSEVEAKALSMIGKACYSRFQLRRSLADLNEAIKYYEQALHLRASDDPFRVEDVGDLGAALMDRYESIGDSHDIDCAIELQREAARNCPRVHPAYPDYLGSLITMLFSRNRTSGNPGDLEEALLHCKTVIELRPDDRMQNLLFLSNYLFALTARYAQTSDPRDLEQMQKLRQTILGFDAKGEMSFTVDVIRRNAALPFPGMTPTKDEADERTREDGLEMYSSVDDRVQMMIFRADTHALRFQETKDEDAFARAEDTYSQTLALLAAGHPRRLSVLQGLMQMYETRFHDTKDTKYLDSAIKFSEDALALTHPHTRAHSIEKHHLGTILSQRYWKDTTSDGIVFMRAARDHLEDVASALECPLHVRFHASQFWATISVEHVAFSSEPKSALDGYRTAFTILPQLAWLGADTRASLHAVEQSTGLPADAATYALLHDHTEEAVEFLELGRSVIWNQATRLRTPVDEVEVVAPELARKLKILSRKLEGGILSGAMVSAATEKALTSPTSPEVPVRTPWQLRQDWLSVIESIRALPGFTHFLDKKPFSALSSAANEGPVVVLIAHERLSVALVLSEEGAEPLCVPLKATVEKLKSLHGVLRNVANSRGRGPKDGPPVDDDEVSEQGEDEMRAGRVRRSVKVVESGDTVLTTLWQDVAEPVIKHLTDLKKPNLDDRKRIWWCTVGHFVFMPIHAAGTSSLCVSDFFISSYTPTLDALLATRSRSIPNTTRVLAAIQPNAGNGWTSLPNTKAELKEVRAIVPQEDFLALSVEPQTTGNGGPATQLDLDGELEGSYTTSSAILARLPEASVFHLACHGDQLPSNPLQSGFIMKDGERLTVEMLMRAGAGSQLNQADDDGHSRGGGGIALLSACHTAGNDPERPDEAINLASVMLFVGFRSVLATMWPMGDPDGPVITRAIYKALFNDAQKDMSKFCLARTLDVIVRGLKKSGIPSERWATFIHIGA